MDPNLMTRLAEDPPSRLGIWACTYVKAQDYRRRQGLVLHEVRIITSPAGARGLYRPVFVRVADWYADPHADEIMRYLTEVAGGTDITGQSELIELVVARIVGLRHAGERKEHGAR